MELSREYLLSAVLRVAVALVFAFLFLPIVVILVASLSGEQYIIRIPPTSISLRWFLEAFDRYWMEPLQLSLVIGIVSVILVLPISVLASFSLARYEFKGKQITSSAIYSPITLPAIVVGAAMLQFFTLALGLRGSFTTLLIGHTIVVAPYVVQYVIVSLQQHRIRNLEWAAMNLGAGRAEVFWKVTLPLIKPGIFAGATFGFITSFNNIPVSLFLIRPGMVTIPIKIIQYLEYGYSPVLAAVCVVTLFIVAVAIAIAERVGQFTKFLQVQF